MQQPLNQYPSYSQEPLLSAQSQRDHDSEEEVYANWRKYHSRFNHVLTNPNAEYGWNVFYEMIRQAVQGKRVLEIGCNTGYLSARIADYGARYVLGTDISKEMIATANQTYAIPGTCEFALHDATLPFDGKFDVIVGSAVLHHFAYQDALLHLERENLSAEGRMFFFEPLASNLCMRLFRSFSKDAHTRDECPFTRKDIRWMHKTFPNFMLIPINYTSVPIGAFSSLLFKSADNVLLRSADGIDRFLAKHASFLHTRFRCAILSFQ